MRDCVHRLIRDGGPDVQFAIQSYFWLRREDGGGLLPQPGTWCDQPASWVEAIELLDAEVGAIRAKRLDEVKTRG